MAGKPKTRSIKDFQKGGALAEEGKAGLSEQSAEGSRQSADGEAPSAPNSGGTGEAEAGAEEAGAAAAEPDVFKDMCRRCRHAPVQHMEGPCQVMGCDCISFVYPPDFEDGQTRLPGGEFEPTEAELELVPLMKGLFEARSARMKNLKLETEYADSVAAVMSRRNLPEFASHGLRVELVPPAGKTKVKISTTGEGVTDIQLSLSPDEDGDETEE